MNAILYIYIDILINVIFGCESELRRLRFGANRERHFAQAQDSAQLESNIVLLSTQGQH